MNQSEVLIHIDWDGPFSPAQVTGLDGASDFGVYQVYGAHSVYGSDVLLYIGLAERQTFSARLGQHGWCGSNSDARNISFYVGRLFGLPHPEDDPAWCRQIQLAERLLIHAHKPAHNTQKELASLEPDLWHVHVVNWRCYRDLMPEVSGARWTMRFEDLSYDTRFTTAHFKKQPNQSLEPTPVLGTSAAEQPLVPSTGVAHL